jgi:hypothetical protein
MISFISASDEGECPSADLSAEHTAAAPSSSAPLAWMLSRFSLTYPHLRTTLSHKRACSSDG